jgi:HPt (histidine-containing phosphotransfer) domain-containing protein
MDKKIDSEEAARIQARISDWTAGDFSFRDRIIREFLAFYPEAFLEFESYERTGDFIGMAKVAHSLKSTVSFMGSERAFMSTKALEDSLTEQDATYAERLLETKENIRQLGDFLRRLIEGENDSET